MLTKLEQLKQGGYSDEEIGEWERTERLRMQDAGYAESEIDDDFGIVRPPNEIPPAFIERMKQGMERTIGAMGQYGQMYFGDQPLGLSKENEDVLKQPGLLDTLSHTPIYGPLLSPEVFFPAVKSIDALLRSVPAGIGAFGAGIGQGVEEALGRGPYGEGTAARDFASLAQIAALLLGMGRAGAGMTRTLAPKAAQPLIALPRPVDFREAAASIDSRPSTFPTQKKLGRIWTEAGVPPLEVAEDANRDPSIAEAIRSDSDKIPDAYLSRIQTPPVTAAPAGHSAHFIEPVGREEVHPPTQSVEPTPSDMHTQPRGASESSAVRSETEVPPTPAGKMADVKGDIFEAQRKPDPDSPQTAGGSRPMEPDRDTAIAENHGEAIRPGGAPDSDTGREPRTVNPENRNNVPLDADEETAQQQGISRVYFARASKEKLGVFNPPEKPQRPFTQDYPGGKAPAIKNILLTDIEGRPLTAEFVAGRRLLGKPDEGLSIGELEAALKRLGIVLKRLPRTRFNPGVYGKYWRWYNLDNELQQQIRINQALSIPDQNIAIAHEFGHAIDMAAGELSKRLTQSEVTPLRSVYGTVRSNSLGTAFLHQPERYGYAPHQVNEELLAEGIRAYMVNPNYFKTVAPKTAAIIRASVNESPALKRVIQLNSLLAAGLVGAGSGKKDDDSQ
jgi:hypothetical protein